MIPTDNKRGASQSSLKDSICAITDVPISAPIITATPAAALIIARPTKEDANRAVAVELCKSIVTPRPESIAVKRFFVAEAIIFCSCPP